MWLLKGALVQWVSTPKDIQVATVDRPGDWDARFIAQEFCSAQHA